MSSDPDNPVAGALNGLPKAPPVQHHQGAAPTGFTVVDTEGTSGGLIHQVLEPAGA